MPNPERNERKNLAVPPALNIRLRTIALHEGTTRDALLEKALADYAAGTPDPSHARKVDGLELIKVSVDPDLWEAAKGRARIEGRTLSDVVTETAERLFP